MLLIERGFEPLKGLWTFPGGRREPGESIEETAIRELQEELAVTVAALRPVLQMPISGGFLLQIFATRSFSGTLTPSPEVAAWRWIEPAAIGPLPTTPGLAEVLDRVFALFPGR